mgnify:CR=1 FL=1
MTINAMTVNAGKALDVLKAGWSMQQNAGIKMSYMLHGRPGIGKTQVAEALARHIGGRLYDIRLTQIDTSDLRGLPYYDHEAQTTKWYRPEDLPRDAEPAVLFLDEITAASPFLQPTVYGLLQERRVGMHKIPDNVIIMAAGNTVDDGAVAYEMGTAIADRLVHMYVSADAEDWIKGYAIPNNLHPAVQAFVKTRPDKFETSQEAMKQDHMIAATPRSWERVSHIMTHVEDRTTRQVMIAGTIGEAITADFMIVADDVAASVRIFDMLDATRKDRVAMYPTNIYGLNALVYGLLGALDLEEGSNMHAAIEILYDLGELSQLRPDEADLKAIPLKELRTFGFETLMDKAMKANLSAVLDSSETMVAYERELEEEGII